MTFYITKNKFLFCAVFCFVVLLVFSPFFTTQAGSHDTGLVPCGSEGQDPCNFCHLLELGQNVIDFVVKTLIIPLGALFIAIGGFFIMFSAGSPDKAKRGRDVIKAAILGVVIALFAWMILDITIRTLANSQTLLGSTTAAPWYQVGANISCP